VIASNETMPIPTVGVAGRWVSQPRDTLPGLSEPGVEKSVTNTDAQRWSNSSARPNYTWLIGLGNHYEQTNSIGPHMAGIV
jgi:hypothetical protein